MKRLLFILVSICLLAPLITACSSEDDSKRAGTGDAGVQSVTDSGCLTRSGEEDQEETIVLTKEGGCVTCELQNYIANCGTKGFEVKVSAASGKNTPDTVIVDVAPLPLTEDEAKACHCPFTVYVTLRDVNEDTFFLKCWWYEGMVTFDERQVVKLLKNNNH